MTIAELFAIRIPHGYILQIFIAEMLFIPILERRKNFVLRLVLSFLAFAFLSIIITNLVYQWMPSGLNSVIIFLLSLAIGFICFKSGYKEILFCYVAAQLLQNLSHNIENTIYQPLSDSITDAGWFFLSVGVMIIVYAAGFIFLHYSFPQNKKISLPSYGVVLFAIFSLLFCYLIQYLFQYFGLDTLWAILLLLIFCDLLVLALMFILQGYKWKYDENEELEQFIAQENRYYKSMQENVDVINMKAHDLKHFIADLRENRGMDDSGLAEIQEAVEKYEQTANTGNEALDSVLTEKMFTCNKNGITFTTMVQGELLDFMRMSDITSVFGNLLSNAIEYELTVENPDQRCIQLNVFKKGALICIHVENYCTSRASFADGLPKTTKGSTDYHGYGLKSVRYIVRKYGGNITMDSTGEMFVVDIIIPVQESQAA
ncbi:MAG: GHKL domain-containing protein [Clostridia bacterium]|nr:GHKL domain-containing protein [Clostridia bacterium]